MVLVHLRNEGKDFLNQPLFALTRVIGLFLRLVDSLFNLISEAVDRIVFDHLFERAHLLEPVLLFFPIDALLLVANLRTLEREVLLLLLVSHDSRLEGRALTRNFRGSRLDELNSLAHVHHFPCFLTLLGLVRAVRPQLVLFEAGLVHLAAKFVCSLDHARILAGDDGVLKKDPGEIKVFVDTALTLEQVVVERVVQSDPVSERLCGTLLEALQGETNRTITFLFSADAAHDNLKSLRGRLVIGTV